MQSPPPTGPWKEGRMMAVSLLYITPQAETFAWVLEHHAAVGIRATWLRRKKEDESLPRSRNWDVREELPLTLPPVLVFSPDPKDILEQVESLAASGGWSLCRFEEDDLRAMGRDAHKRLLQRLGDQHARIWCAPLRDISTFAQSRTAGAPVERGS